MFDCLLLLHLKLPRRNVWRILATKMSYKITISYPVKMQYILQAQ